MAMVSLIETAHSVYEEQKWTNNIFLFWKTVILQTSHGRRSIDVLKLLCPERANWECKFISPPHHIKSHTIPSHPISPPPQSHPPHPS
jgi:hypothetical protein